MSVGVIAALARAVDAREPAVRWMFPRTMTRAGGRPRRYIVVFESCVIPASLEHEFIFAELPDLASKSRSFPAAQRVARVPTSRTTTCARTSRSTRWGESIPARALRTSASRAPNHAPLTREPCPRRSRGRTSTYGHALPLPDDEAHDTTTFPLRVTPSPILTHTSSYVGLVYETY